MAPSGDNPPDVPAGDPTNPQLVNAIREVALHDNEQTRRALYEALLRAVFLLPVTERPRNAGGWERTQEETLVRLLVTRDRNGQHELLVFTDTEGLLRWRPAGCVFIGMKATELFPLALKHGFASIIVNVAGPTGGEITRGELQFLAEGLIPDAAEPILQEAEIPEDTVTYLGTPARQPSDRLVAAVREGLSHEKEVTAAYLFQASIGKGRPRLVLGLYLRDPLPRDVVGLVVRRLMKTVQPALPDGEYLDCIILDRSWTEHLAPVVRAVFQRAA